MNKEISEQEIDILLDEFVTKYFSEYDERMSIDIKKEKSYLKARMYSFYYKITLCSACDIMVEKIFDYLYLSWLSKQEVEKELEKFANQFKDYARFENTKEYSERRIDKLNFSDII